MKHNLMEAGQIINTHGIHGEVKINPWCDSANFLCEFDTFFIDEKPYKVLLARVHKTCVIASLSGISDVNTAMLMKNKVVCIDKSKVQLSEGQHFIADLIGLEVFNEKSGAVIGTIVEILTLPANDVYVVRGEREYMIPVVREFVHQVDLSARRVTVSLIPGMEVE